MVFPNELVDIVDTCLKVENDTKKNLLALQTYNK